jgi:uncharacterized metal-binding protein YceD (DUF177 family)
MVNLKKVLIFATILRFYTIVGKFAIYNIPLKSLSEGSHTYDFQLENKYFSDINDGESDIKRGKVAVALNIKRTGSTFEMNFDVNGDVIVPCDRCLDDITMEVVSQNKLIVKFGREYSEESDEIVIIPEDDGEINIAWFLYEFVSLSLPIKKVHAPGKCNRMMSSKLNKHKTSSNDSDEDSDESTEDDAIVFEDDNSQTDPRWDGLKNIELED